MEMRLNEKLLLLLLIIATSSVYAQKSDEYYIKEVYVNNIEMQSQSEDYRSLFKGRTISDSIIWNDYNEENMRIVVFESDSLYIHMLSYEGMTHLYTKYIEIFSSRYEIELRKIKFKVGMDLNSLKSLMPNIETDYEKYIGENKKYFSRPAYFGKQMILETNDIEVPFYPCQGLKFQIKEGVVISILVDFRTDGDF